jgi:hypothetical protein
MNVLRVSSVGLDAVIAQHRLLDDFQNPITAFSGVRNS